MSNRYWHYTTGEYGLVDNFYRTIWLNVNNESIAHRIKKAFVSKLRLLVVDLTIFSNYTDQLVDSDCCLHWHLPLTLNDHWSTAQSFINPMVEVTHCEYPKDFLVNEEPLGLYTNQQRTELQHQMLFYKKIAELLPSNSALMQSINYVFLVELSVDAIEEKIYQVVIDHLSSDPINSSLVLSIIGRLYD